MHFSASSLSEVLKRHIVSYDALIGGYGIVELNQWVSNLGFDFGREIYVFIFPHLSKIANHFENQIPTPPRHKTPTKICAKNFEIPKSYF